MDIHDPKSLPLQDFDAPDVAGIICQAYRANTPAEEVFNILRPPGDASETREGLLREWIRFSEFFQQLQLRMDMAKE
jgi:hypothetical protein